MLACKGHEGLTDASLPGLGTATRRKAVLELFRSTLPELTDELEMIDGQILNVQYRPGTSCVVLYELKLRDRRTRSISRQLLSAQLLRADESPSTPKQELLRAYQARRLRLEKCGNAGPVLRTAVAYAPEARMVLYAFPADPCLPFLFDILDRSAMTRTLNRVWPNQNQRVREVEVRPLGYTPQARASLRYEVLAESRDSNEIRSLVGKVHARRDPTKLYTDACGLWQVAEGQFGLARPVACVAHLGLTLQETVQGERLTDLVTSPCFVDKVCQTARVAAALHSLSPPLSSRRTAENEVRFVHRLADKLTAILPDLTTSLKRLRHDLAAELENRVTISGPVHGDLHPANVLVNGDHITLIDLDNVAYGDPASDVGRFLASLRTRALRALGDQAKLSEAREAFLDQYLAITRQEETKIRLFEAAWLLHVANYLFEIQWDGWEDEAALTVEEAHRVLRIVRFGAAVAAAPRATELVGHLPDRARWATDGAYMRAILAPFIQEAYGATPMSCRVDSRRKTNKSRQRIRYRLSAWRNGEKLSLSLDGVIWRGHSGRGHFNRLAAVREALAADPDAPLLPRPITYLPQIHLLVIETLTGPRFSELLRGSDGARAAADLGRALAALHGARVELNRSRSLDEELLELRRRIEGLNGRLAGRVKPILEETERCLGMAPPRTAPVLRRLALLHVLCLNGRIAFPHWEDVALSHPLINVADVLAQLTLIGIERSMVAEAANAANCFRRVYFAARGERAEGTAAFEALALLRLAARREQSDVTTECLLACAEVTLVAA